MAKSQVKPAGEDPPASAPARPTPEAAIRGGVLRSLGQPPGLYQVAVLPLWPGHFRVNVLTGADPTTVRIAHSFFVEATDDGAIVAAVPQIARAYP